MLLLWLTLFCFWMNDFDDIISEKLGNLGEFITSGVPGAEKTESVWLGRNGVLFMLRNSGFTNGLSGPFSMSRSA